MDATSDVIETDPEDPKSLAWTEKVQTPNEQRTTNNE